MPLPVVIAAGVAVLKEIGILVSSFVVADWLMDKPNADQALGEGWIADIKRQMYADEYQATYDEHAPHLSGPALSKLHAHTVLAKKAVMEPTATVYNGQADVMADGLEAAADKLMALEQGAAPSGAGAQVQLLPAIDLAGGEMVLTVGGSPAPPAAAIWPAVVVLGALGAGAFFAWGR